MVDGRTPVMVVTGFLGSGKTTLVNHLLGQPGLAESFVVVNEFGEVPVDHYLLESAEERTVALPNGCLCCHLRGDLEEALVGAAMRRRRGEIAGFDRVIVETSGIADPGPVAQTLYADQALARDFKLGSIVTVVDAADPGNRRLAGEVARAQIAAADVIVLSKSDRASASDIEIAAQEVRGINPHAQQVPAANGDVDPQRLLAATHKSGTDPDFSHAAHPGSIRSFVLRFEAPVERGVLEHFLSTLVQSRGADLLRVKGAVPLTTGETVVVQGVRHVFDKFRPVAKAAPGLVFITHDLGEPEVRALWTALQSLYRRNA